MATAGTVTSVTTRVGHSPVSSAIHRVIEVQLLTREHQSAAEMAASPVRERQQRLPDSLMAVPVHQANQMSGTGVSTS
jgi:hypothetical protein